jgi:ribosome biogenesis GTPase
MLTAEASVDEVFPRTSIVSRASASRDSEEQHLAANVDVVVVVEPVGPQLSVGRVERLLVLAWSSGATPLVALTKSDLAQAPALEGVVEQIRPAAVGVDVVCVSARRGDGVDALRAHLGAGRTFVLLGPSGAGKSTLVNALAGESTVATAEVRGDGRGRHTTTHRQLVLLADGSAVIDTPGLRSVGLVGDVDAVDSTFTDILDLASECRFRDCAHEHEPGCAVRDAVGDGRLTHRRLESWRKLGREAAFQARRGDARLQREERARVRARTKAWRRSPNRPSY